MARVVPSQVVAFIDQVFPWARTQIGDQKYKLTMANLGQLAGLLDLINQIPAELLTLDGPEYCNLVCSLASTRDYISRWQLRGEVVGTLSSVPGISKFSPVTLIREALAICPDESPAPADAQLGFIGDSEFRENLRRDLGATNRALSNGEWKASTVLAGSVVEALLLWSLKQHSEPDIRKVTEALTSDGSLSRMPDGKLERWNLEEYIEVAFRLRIVTENTTIQAKLAKDYRNLIHPGRAERLGQQCDRGTALSAAAAVEHVVNDLTKSTGERLSVANS